LTEIYSLGLSSSRNRNRNSRTNTSTSSHTSHAISSGSSNIRTRQTPPLRLAT
jgi:hypothetical protein